MSGPKNMAGSKWVKEITSKKTCKKKKKLQIARTFLVVQYLRIHLAMQGT